MSYLTLIQELPRDLQLTMLRLVESVEQNIREQYAVRREDFDALKSVVQDMATSQNRTEQRVEELVEAQKRTEQRVERLEIVVTELAEAQKRTEQRVAELAEAQRQTEQRLVTLTDALERTEAAVRRLADKQNEMSIKLDRLIGDNLERRYREKGCAYLGELLRRVKTVDWEEVIDNAAKQLNKREMSELLALDLLLRGRVIEHPEHPEVWLAMEVSALVNHKDVERAVRRAALLRRAGYVAIPTVAGEEVDTAGEDAARANHVFMLQNGRKLFWQEALQIVLADGKR